MGIPRRDRKRRKSKTYAVQAHFQNRAKSRVAFSGDVRKQALDQIANCTSIPIVKQSNTRTVHEVNIKIYVVYDKLRQEVVTVLDKKWVEDAK